MSYDNQLARRLAVHNKARRAARTKRPMCIKPRWYSNKGMVWNMLGLYGQVIAGYKTPARAKKALRQAQWVYRSVLIELLADARRNFDDIDTAAVQVEVCLVETEHRAGQSCIRE